MKKPIFFMLFMVWAVLLIFQRGVYADLPFQPVRSPAEFEPVEYVVMRWDSSSTIIDLQAFLVKYIQLAKAQVIMFVTDDTEKTSVINFLVARRIPVNSILFIITHDEKAYYPVWTRDYFAQSIYYSQANIHGLVDAMLRYPMESSPLPYDYNAPLYVANMLDLPLFRTDDDPYHVKLAYEMGNFLTDGFGFVISSDDLLNFNGETTDIAEYWLTNCYGISRFMVADHIEHNARAKHIDQYMKFLDEETLLVGQLAPTNPKAVEIEQKIENQINELMSSYLSVWGRPFKVVRIPFPDLTDELASVFYTYTNSLIVNNYVLVPLYGVAEDQQALQIYKENMPAHRVVGYDCREIIQYGGAIHCITHEIARKHSLIPSSGQLPDTLTVPNGSYSSYERFVARNFISAGAGVSVKAGGFVVAKTAGTIRLKSGFSAKNGCFFRAYISNY